MGVAERRVPVQGDGPWSERHIPGRGSGTVPWSVHLEAWTKGYAPEGFGQSAETIARRGGFGYRELQCCLAGHYWHKPEYGEHPPVPGWEPAK